MLEFKPPWRDASGYVDVRLNEALYEADLAIKFLEQGLHRNAAGKAFQAWKAVLAAAAALNRDLVAKRYPGTVKDRVGVIRSRVDMVIALMPTVRMREVAGILMDKYGWEVLYLTDLALSIHEFQYNGLDPGGIVSKYVNVHDAERDVRHLAEKAIEWAKRLGEAKSN
ncbi:PaREP1 family protein [Caldivirga sp. UBA161]|uniref:PaREP1 family protein n=1 Tax=Caldivirga sp. UBA161 TaxID=1915569 RepID=UPI0025BC2C56|nr:PaREP1 family protein [Caldivirga sp. UBA161]